MDSPRRVPITMAISSPRAKSEILERDCDHNEHKGAIPARSSNNYVYSMFIFIPGEI